MQEQAKPPKHDLLCPISQQSPLEELFNSITHGLGLVLSIVGLVVLTIFTLRHSFWLFLCCSVFGVTMTLTYAASTFYHSTRFLYFKSALQAIDHSCIYLLIAGTYTPFTLLCLKGTWGWVFFSIVWAVAFFGIAIRLIYSERFALLKVFLYLAMGWAAVFIIPSLYQNLPPAGFALLVAGGLTYTVGVVFYLLDRMPYNHSIWHLFVLGGSACHFFSISTSLVPGL